MVPPDPSPDSFASLREILRSRRLAALIADAELIRDAPESDERDDAACRAIREVMLLSTLGKITCGEREYILDILSFAVAPLTPPDAPPRSGADLDPFDTHGTLP